MKEGRGRYGQSVRYAAPGDTTVQERGTGTDQAIDPSRPGEHTAEPDSCPHAFVPAGVIVPAADLSSSTLIERIERALVLLAYFIEADGDVHIAMYERFETERHELKRKASTKERARRLLWATAAQAARTRSAPDI